MSVWSKLWWVLLGAFFCFEALIYLGAFGSDGGAMPWQPFALVFFGIGGLLFFLLTHILVRKIEANNPSKEDTK